MQVFLSILGFRTRGKSGIIGGVFMSKPKHSVDGFVPRNRDRTIGVAPVHTPANPKLPQVKDHAPTPGIETDVRPRVGVSRSEIDDSLKQIDEPERDVKGRVKKTPEQKAKRKKIIKRVVLALLSLIHI